MQISSVRWWRESSNITAEMTRTIFSNITQRARKEVHHHHREKMHIITHHIVLVQRRAVLRVRGA